jgi:hypothetical protein
MDMTPRTHSTRADRRGRFGSAPLIAAAIVVVAFAVLVAVYVSPPDRRVSDASLPNPMGGMARTAPGEVTGGVQLAGLQIAGAEVAMGEVALGVTYVPGWEVTNPTGRKVAFAAGQPQVLEGCCPGPIYVDGELTQVDQRFAVPPGGSVLVQFPLQMHAGMDGPHHLAIPLLADGEQEAVHVTGNFSQEAFAS